MKTLGKIGFKIRQPIIFFYIFNRAFKRYDEKEALNANSLVINFVYFDTKNIA